MTNDIQAECVFRARAAMLRNEPKAAIEAAIGAAWHDNAAIREEARRVLAHYGVTVEDNPPSAIRDGERIFPAGAATA